MMGSTIFASDVAETKSSIADSQEVTVSREMDENAEIAKEAVSDYDVQWTKRAEDVLENGVRLNQSITKNNIIFTLESLYSDTYCFRLVCSVQKVDQSPLTDEETDLGEFAFETKEDIEQIYGKLNEEGKFVKDNTPKIMSFEEMIKEAAKEDENLRQFINEDGSIDEAGVEAYYTQLYASEEYEATATETGGCGITSGSCKVAGSSDKKIYFFFEGSRIQPLPEVLQLMADEVEIDRNKTTELEFNLIDYLQENTTSQPKTKYNDDIEHEYKWLESLNPDDEEYKMAKEDIDKMPKQVLEEANLNIRLSNKDSVPVLNNIGFVNNQLHILLTKEEDRKNHHNLKLYNEQGELVYSVWGRTSTDYVDEDGKQIPEDQIKEIQYYVYDIPDVKALEGYRFAFDSYEREVIAEGPWLLDVTMQPTKEHLKKELNQEIKVKNNEGTILKEIDLTPLSLYVKIEHKVRKQRNNHSLGEVILRMKDGSQISLEYSDAHWTKDKEENLVFIMPNKLISLADVECITIGGQTITLE